MNLKKRYFWCTRTATYGFLAALPLFLLYELLVVVGQAGPMAVRVGAELWTKQFLALMGVGGHLALGGVLLLIGGGIFWYERKKNVPIKTPYFLGMLVESVFYAVALALVVSQITGLFFAVVPGAVAVTNLGLAVGAGLYEELIFRVLLVGGLSAGFYRLSKMSHRRAYLIAALLGALIFSAVHYLGALGDVFTLPSFTFRFLFGLALNGLYLMRGFGIAAWTHALYDIMLMI